MHSELFRRDSPTDVIAATEANLRLVSRLNGDFVAPALNEWRYATRHMANLLERPNDDAEREKALRHLERAYFDSSDILLTIVLDGFRAFDEDFGEYPEIVQNALPEFGKWRIELRDAKRLLTEGDRSSDRFESARKMDAVSGRLLQILDEIDENRPSLVVRVKKARQRERRELLALAAGLVAAVAAVLALLLR